MFYFLLLMEENQRFGFNVAVIFKDCSLRIEILVLKKKLSVIQFLDTGFGVISDLICSVA
jgi:hypothetical protein